MVARVLLLLVGSGFCSLVYQVAWLRLLRQIFGASTASSAAVLAIFMAGLGIGGLYLGRRSDRTANPLKLYADLELGIAVAAGLSPLLVLAVRSLYVAAGGTQLFGAIAGTTIRLLLAAVVLAVPTFLMGGTLPAMARAVTRPGDLGRRVVGLLYAANTLGAVGGAVISNFTLIEMVGIRQTLWLAALANLLIALAARSLSRRWQAPEPTVGAGDAVSEGDSSAEGRPSLPLALAAAALVGFVFFLMELVWYRMMSPVLGGSTYTFGVILAVALLGIGVGGLVYGWVGQRRRPTVSHFALSCALEAVFLGLPLALGDRIAFLALVLRDLQGLGFLGLVFGWLVVTGLVVFPAAVVAGYQFPLLVAIVGTGRERVGREVGLTYAWNTAGSIAGSIAGGFGLLSLLSAPGTWQLSVWLLCFLALAFALQGHRVGAPVWRLVAPVSLAWVGVGLTLAEGPTALWRHGSIGAGRGPSQVKSPNDLRKAQNESRRFLRWEADGLESSVALMQGYEYALYINGKSDGAALSDSPNMVMAGLVGAMLHPDPRSSLVIGLGTGATAGWLADVPSMEQVAVVELEPRVIDVARACAPVNRGVLENPKVEVLIGDGRELLLTTDRRFDIVFSQPSNPYRAGVASLFTRDFYRAVVGRLNEGGILLQWLQGYEVDAGVVRTAVATLGDVFDEVEIWQVHLADLLLVASNRPLDHDPERLRRVVNEELFSGALQRVWGVAGLEGLYSGYVASPRVTRLIAEAGHRELNTDDHPIMEFGFARQVGRASHAPVIDALRLLARQMGEDHPPGVRGVEWARVSELRAARQLFFGGDPDDPGAGSNAGRWQRSLARQAFREGDLAAVARHWLTQDAAPEVRVDLLMVSEALAQMGDPRALAYAGRLEALHPVEATVVRSRLQLRQGRVVEAADLLQEAFELHREEPWVWLNFMKRALALAREIATEDPQQGLRLFQGLSLPFAVGILDQDRIKARVDLARIVDFPRLCVEALAEFEPHVPWGEAFLRLRRDCYASNAHALSAVARQDLEDFYAESEPRIWQGLTSELESGEESAGRRSPLASR